MHQKKVMLIELPINFQALLITTVLQSETSPIRKSCSASCNSSQQMTHLQPTKTALKLRLKPATVEAATRKTLTEYWSKTSKTPKLSLSKANSFCFTDTKLLSDLFTIMLGTDRDRPTQQAFPRKMCALMLKVLDHLLNLVSNFAQMSLEYLCSLNVLPRSPQIAYKIQSSYIFYTVQQTQLRLSIFRRD